MFESKTKQIKNLQKIKMITNEALSSYYFFSSDVVEKIAKSVKCENKQVFASRLPSSTHFLLVVS